MARLNVPTRYRKGVSALLALDRAAFDEFVALLKSQAEAAEQPLELTDIFIRGLEKTASRDILSAIMSLYRAWAETADFTIVDTFVNELAKAITTFDTVGESRESKERLLKILAVEPLIASSRAGSVLEDNERDFYEVRILTDIRYAFRPNPKDEPYGAVVVHMLKLTYHEALDHKSFFIALDGEDLKKLRSAIDRAEAKEEHYRLQLEASQIHYFGKSEDE